MEYPKRFRARESGARGSADGTESGTKPVLNPYRWPRSATNGTALSSAAICGLRRPCRISGRHSRSGGRHVARAGGENERIDESIRLGQFLKLAGLAEHSAHTKVLTDDEDVTVNGHVEVRRGRQLHDRDVITVGDEQVRLSAAPDRPR